MFPIQTTETAPEKAKKRTLERYQSAPNVGLTQVSTKAKLHRLESDDASSKKDEGESNSPNVVIVGEDEANSKEDQDISSMVDMPANQQDGTKDNIGDGLTNLNLNYRSNNHAQQ